MQSSWQRIASNAFRVSGPANFRPLRPRKYLKTNFISSQCRRAHASAAAHSSGSSPLGDADEPCTAPTLDPLERPLTHSRVAFEAAKAIRLAVSQGNLLDAYHILNSVHYAQHRSSSSGLMKGLLSLLPKNVFTSEAIPFNPQTPTRLVTHSLLHSLVRYGYLPEAVRLSEELLKNNIKVHWASLDAVFKAATDPSIPFKSCRPGPVSLKRFTNEHHILSTTSIPGSFINHRGGAYALSLLNVARQSRQRRTRGMFKALIALCIINGEIIVASLIFGLMVKDWNARVLELAGTQEDPPPRPENGDPQELASRAILIRHQRTTPWPSENRLEEILAQIDQILRVRDHSTRPHVQAALQALANLAVLLDQRLIPFESVGSLIRMLTRAQTCRGSVRVPQEDGELETVEAHVFFRSVLFRLCVNPPRVASRRHATIQPPDRRNKGFMPALDEHSYNHLLRFALDYEESAKIADRVVRHMTTKREPPLQPSRSVIERFREGAVRLRSESLWERATKLERMVGHSEQTRAGYQKSLLTRRYAGLLKLPDISTKETIQRIDFLTKNGEVGKLRPHFEYRALPGYGDRLEALRNGVTEVDAEVEGENMRLAVARGPRAIISVLTALAKVHKSHTAQRVWHYAKAVEAFSWTTPPDPERGVLPWTLPIEAYTVMLGIHTRVLNRGARYRFELQKGHRGRKQQYVAVPLIPREIRITNRGKRTKISLWRQGEYVRVTRQRAWRARKLALEIYRSARATYDEYAPMVDEILSSPASDSTASSSLSQDNLLHQDHELPAPDAIFYNAILRIVEPDTGRVPKTQNLEEVKSQLRDAERLYESFGVVPQEASEELVMVGRDMLEGGFPIPPGFRPYFVGSGLKYEANAVENDPVLWKSLYRLWVGRKVKPLRKRDRARGLQPRRLNVRPWSKELWYKATLRHRK